MKNYICIFLFLIVSYSSSSGQKVEYSVDTKKIIYLNEDSVIEKVELYDSKNVLIQLDIYDTARNCVIKTFFPNGNLKSIEKVDSAMYTEYHTCFFKSGDTSYIAKDNYLNSSWYYKNNKIKLKKIYTEHKNSKYRIERLYYYKNGNLKKREVDSICYSEYYRRNGTIKQTIRCYYTNLFFITHNSNKVFDSIINNNNTDAIYDIMCFNKYNKLQKRTIRLYNMKLLQWKYFLNGNLKRFSKWNCQSIRYSKKHYK